MKRKIAIAVGVAVVVIAIAFFADSLPSGRPKSPSIDLRSLISSRPVFPAESNGFALLVQAGKLVTVSGSEPVLNDFTNWNEAEAQSLVASNQAALAALHEALALPYLQVDAVTNTGQNFDYFSGWRRLAELAVAQARLTFNSGQEWQGFCQAEDVVRFGQRIEGSGGEKLHYFVGSAIKGLGLYCIGQLAGRSSLTSSNLVLLANDLTNFEASQDILRDALKVDYTITAKRFDEINSTIATGSAFYARLWYDNDRTKEDLAVQILDTLKASTNHYADGISCIPVENTNVTIISRLLHGNATGAILNDMNLEGFRGTLVVKCRENVSVQSTRVLLALRAFQITNHRAANSLQELVPGFLAAVPLDDFDGKPLRYNPALKEVYSVGPDLKDTGGIKSTNARIIIFHFN